MQLGRTPEEIDGMDMIAFAKLTAWSAGRAAPESGRGFIDDFT